ncbi:uncharacterized protein LOC112187453 [Rosa chinensis]|uniref:uncharacterized protein LOC112187453 n=1 Tax=Rosa chinensis TaxID=74649 RepID=UPI000D08C115|nr:uncharacterized protein LOC112187453 [Rosa chinensis]
MAAAATTLFLKLSFTRHHFTPPPLPLPTSTNPFPLHRRRSSSSLPRNPGRCLAANSGPPQPPPESDQTQLSGLAGSLSQFQDKVHIFFAVLFWMSLFFWASVWDDRDRPNKGSRFRR